MMQNHLSDRKTAPIYASILCVVLAPGILRAAVSKVTAIRVNACAAMQADYDRITAASKDDPDLRNFRARLSKLDVVSTSLFEDFDARQAAFLKKSLAAVGGASGPPAAATNKAIGAAKILSSAGTDWRSPLPLPASASAADREILRGYYDTSVAALQRAVLQRAQQCLRIGDTAEIARLAFVLPLLSTDDVAWTNSNTNSLPAWMTQPEPRRAMEDLALHASRPHTAFLLHFHSQDPATKSPGAQACAAYLRDASDALCRERDYPTAIGCLRTALEASESAGATPEIIALHFQIAEIQAATLSFDAAAAEAKFILPLSPDPGVHGRAAMLRLKYLCEGKHLHEVTAEAAAFADDPNCDPYLPHILYIAWAAERQSGEVGADKQWRNRFLQKFPDHPLGATIYLAAVMDAMAAGQPDEAIRLLEFIEHHYPTADVQHVQELKSRLVAAKNSAIHP